MERDPVARLRLTCPYPLPTVDPNWLTSTVVAMASGIRAEGAWDRLPILADALQDAGCEDDEILYHLRGQRQTRCYSCRLPNDPTRPAKVPYWDCSVCDRGGYITVKLPCQHITGNFPNRNGGCWEGTCWVVQLLLGEPQRVVVRYQRATGNDDVHVAYAPLLNPGDDVPQHRVWLVVPLVHHDPPVYAVESRNAAYAEDVLVDDDDFGAYLRLSDEELKDYVMDYGEWSDTPRPPEYRCNWTGSGHPYDGENIDVSGDDAVGYLGLRYVGPGIPYDGVSPKEYAKLRDEGG